MTTAEQEFAKAIAPKFPALRGVLYSYAFELKDHVTKDFTVKPEWRDEFYKRLAAAKIAHGSQAVRRRHTARESLARRSRSRGSRSATRRRSAARFRMIRSCAKALEVLRKGQTQKDLFSIARADATPAH